MTAIDAKRLRKLAEKATPGEWWTTRDVRPHAVWAGTGSSDDPGVCTSFTRPDATYIAAIDPPTLLALLDRLEAAIAYVDDPGNWSAYDARRRLLLDILNGSDPR
ncbi:MAG: ead/Ea22-like family protein [Microbacterium gubbeenense]|uniref:ead/Ea22-like family protein n=1 Tax=Microbacterium gubbeenense TaxID=159896 RepID=UPI003F966FDB